MASHAPSPITDRDRFFLEAAEFTPLVAVDSDHSRFIISTGDEAVARRLFHRGRRTEMKALERAIGALDALGAGDWVRGTTFLDIGANIGTSTIPALRSHDFKRAVACEPEPENFRLLKVNATINDLNDRVLALPVAVSDRSGESLLALDPANSGAHRVVSEERAQREKTITVETVSIDYLIRRGILDADEVGLIWIDAQGYEGHVLHGASELLVRGVPVVFEFHPEMLRNTGGLDVLTKLISKRYTHFLDLRRIDPEDDVESELTAARNITALLKRFDADAEARFTDLLAVRLENGSVGS
jgi:FkbM family methyltransferase